MSTMTAKHKKNARNNKKSAQNVFKRQSFSRSLLLLFLIVVPLAFIGTYLAISSFAYNSVPGDVYLGTEQQTTKHQTGETFKVTLYVDTYNISNASALYLALSVDSVNTQMVKQGNAVCNPNSTPGITCSGGVYSSTSPSSIYTNRDADYCIKFDPNTFGRKGLGVISVIYATKKASPYNLGANASWSSSSCTKNGYIDGIGFTAKGYGFGIGIEGTSGGCQGSCSGGGGGSGGGGNGGGGDGSGGNGDGNGGGTGDPGNSGSGGTSNTGTRATNVRSPQKTPTPSSSGNKGNSANTQSEDQNPLPAASDQGNAKSPPPIEPSPFFDGKQFARGSLPDKLGLNATLTSTGGRIATAGITAILIGGLGVVGFYIYTRRQLHK